MLSLTAGRAYAGDLSTMYDPATLGYWQTRFTISTTKLFEAIEKNLLLGDEAEQIDGTRLDFPTIPPGKCPKSCPNPFDFYSNAMTRPATITMPILSILFLNDLMIAYAWLRVNGYDIETVTNYVDMLRFKSASEFPNGYPPPLKALHIPDNALDDARVNEMSLSLFNDARAFVLGHEMGHIYAHDPGNLAVSPQESQKREQGADAFAMKIMKRDHRPPVGMVVYFTALAQWDPSQADTHPLSPQRLLATADDLNGSASEFGAGNPENVERVQLIAQELRILAIGDPEHGKPGGLADPEVQASEQIVGMSATVDSLYPRRPGELLPSKKANLSSGPAQLFDGRYHGTYTRLVSGETESLPMVVALERNGTRIHGRFNFGLGDGAINGILIGSNLELDWSWGGTVGKGVLRASPDGNGFSGTWGYAEARSGGGSWEAKQR
jgi:hypothetical protein